MQSFIKVTAIILACGWSGAALADGDATKGQAVFNKYCKVCHQVGPNAKAGVGPEQNGLVGSKAGARPGYSYSKAMADAGSGGLVWTEENLNKYLENPKAVVAGTKMIFAGVKSPEDRADLIAFLKTQK